VQLFLFYFSMHNYECIAQRIIILFRVDSSKFTWFKINL